LKSYILINYYVRGNMKEEAEEDEEGEEKKKT
jgi:hypothetical protein